MKPDPTNSHIFDDISQGSGVAVPLHSHDDAEDFVIVSGTQQVLIETDEGIRWVDAHAGDHVRVTGSALHAHRNVSDRPAVDLIVTTARMRRMFREIGRPFTGTPLPVTPEALANFMEVSAR